MRYIDIELVPESRRSGQKSRASTMLSAKCQDSDGFQQDIRIRNLSQSGLGGVCIKGYGFENGQSVTVLLRGTKWIRGRIVWVDDKRFGLVFDRRFDIASLDIASWWTGPGFEVSALHAPSERAWRPPLRSG